MLKVRIEILEQGNVISKEVADYTKQVVDLLYEEIPAPDMGKAEMFITHVAMATQRTLTGAPVEGPDETIWEEIISSENYAKANAFCNKMQAIAPIACPEGEKKFIMIHLCNLLEG